MLPPILRDTFRRLRTLLRLHALIDGTASLVFLLGILFWFDLLGDRFLQPGPMVRAFLLLGFCGLIGYCSWKFLFRRILTPIPDRNLALLLERYVPNLAESLITSVDLLPNNTSDAVRETKKKAIPKKESRETESEKESQSQSFLPLFLHSTLHLAASELQSVDVHSLFRYKRLYFRIVCVILLGVLIGGFCASFSETASLWFSRNILLSSKQWPRLARISVEGFDSQHRAFLARGDSFPLVIRADATAPQVPGTVRVLLQAVPGENEQGENEQGENEQGKNKEGEKSANANKGVPESKSVLLDRFSTETIKGTEFRSFLHTIPELLDPLDLSIAAGDARIEGLRIEVVPPPTILDMEMRFEYPAYMQRPPGSVSPTERTVFPQGTSLFLAAKTNKPVRSVLCSINGQPATPVDDCGDDSFRLSFRDVREDILLEFSLEDEHGIRNRQPLRWNLEMSKDQPPVVVSRLDGIGTAITPIAVLPILGEISDDYGLVQSQIRYTELKKSRKPDSASHSSEENDSKSDKKSENGSNTENDTKSGETTDQRKTYLLAQWNGTTTHVPLAHSFSVAELQFQPGDRLTFWIEATDAFFLPSVITTQSTQESPLEKKDFHSPASQGQTGIGDRFSLEIVSEAQLRGILEAKEVGLRMRFEALIEEARRTRPFLEELQFEVPKTDSRDSRQDSDSSGDSTPVVASESPDRISDEQANSGAYNISRAKRDSEKEQYELLGILNAFADIRKEMLNNRIFSPEAQERIDRRLSEPMRGLIETEFRRFDRLVSELSQKIDDRKNVSRSEFQRLGKETLEQWDRILTQMSAIRDAMLRMESFNEAVELLREILKEQRSLREETAREKQKSLRDLLE